MSISNISIEPNNPWELKWYTNWDEIQSEEFQLKWKQLIDSSSHCTPFYYPSLVEAWVETHGGRQNLDPLFLIAKNKESTEILLPFIRIKTSWKQGFIKRMFPIGHLLFDYHDPIIFSNKQQSDKLLDDELFNELIREIQSQGSDWYDSFSLPRIRNNLLNVINNKYKITDRAPYLDLSAYNNFEEYFNSRKKSLRSDIKRQINHLQNKGEITLKVYTANELNDVYNWIPDLEKNRKLRYPTSKLPSGWLKNLVKHGLPENIVHCSCLFLNETQLSWHIGFSNNNTIYWYVPIYNLDYGDFSPGKIHIYYMLKWAFENNIKIFDFLRGCEVYKAGWTDGSQYEMVGFDLENNSNISYFRKASASKLNKLGYLKQFVLKR